jgi:hypothetical protein
MDAGEKDRPVRSHIVDCLEIVRFSTLQSKVFQHAPCQCVRQRVKSGQTGSDPLARNEVSESDLPQRPRLGGHEVDERVERQRRATCEGELGDGILPYAKVRGRDE